MRPLDHPLLPESETRKLIAAYRAGDDAAAERVIAHNERAIYRVARRYHATGVCGDVPMDDLCQLGRIGILRAMKDFDLDGDTLFMTYAWNWIRQYISRYGKREGQQVALSFRASEHRGKVGQAMCRFEQQHHRKATRRDIAAITGLSEEYIGSLRANVKSFEEKIDDSRTLADVVADPGGDPARDCEERLMLHYFSQMVKKLSPRCRKVLVRYYGLDGKPAASLTAIAKKMHITPQRVKEIKDDALAELRRYAN